mgnify:FL=1
MAGIKDVRGYLDRMDRSFIRNEKLFFFDYINLEDYDYIVDFGAANGAMIAAIQARQFNENTTYIMVENNSQIEVEFDLKRAERVSGLEDIWGRFPKGTKVLLILSSVVHELTKASVAELAAFIHRNVDTIVIRDMYWGKDEDLGVPKQEADVLRRVQASCDLCKRYEAIKQANGVGSSERKNLYEFFLKYTYTQNWDTEVKEHYFNKELMRLIESMDEDFERTYWCQYVLPFKRNEVLEKFGYEMTHPTHLKAMFARR